MQQKTLSAPIESISDDLFSWNIIASGKSYPYYNDENIGRLQAFIQANKSDRFPKGSGDDLPAEGSTNPPKSFLFIANDSIMIYHGWTIISHRKCTFYREFDEFIDKFKIGNAPSNFDLFYVHGDGTDKVEEVSAGDIANLVKLEICWDLQKHIRAWRNPLRQADISFCHAETSLNSLKNFLPETSFGKDPVIIIQSNYTNVSEVVQDLPDGSFVIQSDPVAPCVFLINYPEDLRQDLAEIDNLVDLKLKEGKQGYDKRKAEIVRNFTVRLKNLIEWELKGDASISVEIGRAKLYLEDLFEKDRKSLKLAEPQLDSIEKCDYKIENYPQLSAVFGDFSNNLKELRIDWAQRISKIKKALREERAEKIKNNSLRITQASQPITSFTKKLRLNNDLETSIHFQLSGSLKK